jgi:hypothetical protein
LVNEATTTTAFTAYSIIVNNSSTNTLLVGNPTDKNLATGPNGIFPRISTNPKTTELTLTEQNANSPNYNTSAAAILTAGGEGNGNGPASWSVDIDGYNANQSAFGLAEGPAQSGTSDTITLAVNGSIDLGHIFSLSAAGTPQSDLTFTWQPDTSAGNNQGAGGTTYTGMIDTVSAPEPGTLGILAMGGVMMMRRRRKTPAARSNGGIKPT